MTHIQYIIIGGLNIGDFAIKSPKVYSSPIFFILYGSNYLQQYCIIIINVRS